MTDLPTKFVWAVWQMGNQHEEAVKQMDGILTAWEEQHG